jgi:hypothetical protein
MKKPGERRMPSAINMICAIGHFSPAARTNSQNSRSQSSVMFERYSGFYNHLVRTLVIDATGHLQMVFPTG